MENNLHEELKSAVFPFPREWEADTPLDQLYERINQYRNDQFRNFVQVLNVYLDTSIRSQFVKSEEIEGGIRDTAVTDKEVVKKLIPKIKVFISRMFTEYPQFEPYRQRIALAYMENAQLDIYFFGCKDLLIYAGPDVLPIVNSVAIAKELLGKAINLDYSEFIKKANLL